MKWQEVCENKYLKDFPFKIELNKWGQIVMSPAKPKHSIFQGLISDLLNSLIFYNRQGELETSLLVPDFPQQIGRNKQ